jgi:hypothetical protein
VSVDRGTIATGKYSPRAHRTFETVMLHVGNHADDGDPLGVLVAEPDAAFDRICTRAPECADEALVDDDHRRILVASVRILQEPARPEPDPHGFEVSGSGCAREYDRILAVERRDGALDVVEIPPVAPSGGHVTSPAASTPGSARVRSRS